jgi:hypothetical protein
MPFWSTGDGSFRFLSAGGQELRGVVLGRPAQSVKQRKKDYGDPRSYQRIDKKLQREKWCGMIQQHALGDGQYGLMKMKKQKDKAKPADGMLCVNPRAH